MPEWSDADNGAGSDASAAIPLPSAGSCTSTASLSRSIGVTPPGFFGVAPGLAPEITIPLTTLQTGDSLAASTSSSWLHMMGRLRDGMTLKAGEHGPSEHLAGRARVDHARVHAARSAERAYLGRTTALEPGEAGFSRVRNQFQEPLWVLLGAGRPAARQPRPPARRACFWRAGSTRRREIAVRLAIGASRGAGRPAVPRRSDVWTAASARRSGSCSHRASAGALVSAISTWRDPIALDVRPNARILLFASGLALLTASLGRDSARPCG